MRVIPAMIGVGLAVVLAPKILPMIPVEAKEGFGLDDVVLIAWLTLGAWVGVAFAPKLGI